MNLIPRSQKEKYVLFKCWKKGIISFPSAGGGGCLSSFFHVWRHKRIENWGVFHRVIN